MIAGSRQEENPQRFANIHKRQSDLQRSAEKNSLQMMERITALKAPNWPPSTSYRVTIMGNTADGIGSRST